MHNQRTNSTARRLAITIAAALTAILLAGVSSGCASRPGVVFTPADGQQVWPAPPETSRIRYLGSLVSSSDLNPSQSGAASLGELLFGREVPRGMVNPMGVCTDGGERVFVVDSGARVVHVFDLDTQRYESWSTPEGEPGMVMPVAAAYDRERNRVIVADAAAGVLWCFSMNGKVEKVIGKGTLKRPCGLALQAGTGNMYVADVTEHAIVILNPEGVEVGRLGARGNGQGEFNFPTFVAFDKAGSLYVSDSLNFRVSVFGPDRAFVRQIGKKGDIPGYFSQPKGVATDQDNHLYVVDANFEAVQIFDEKGSLLLAIGHEGRGPGEFWLPAGIFIDPKDRVWVADTYNRRVQVFQYLRAGGTP